MPRRPIAHQTGDAGVRLFWDVLPKAWVFREKVRDYGIDVEVEVFEENGNATGLMFLAQIRGTLTPAGSGRSVSLDIDRIRYYNSLELPVLVVRCFENEGEIYARWSRSIDLFYAKDGTKTYGVPLEESHKWDPSRPAAIVRELRDMRHIKAPGFSLPLSFSISASCSSICGIPTAVISSEIRRIAENAPGLFVVRSEGDHPLGHVAIGGSEVALTLAHISGCVIHSIDRLSQTEIRHELPQYILLGFGIALYGEGHYRAASAIIQALSTPMMRRYPKLAPTIIDTLFRDGRLEHVLELWESIGDGPNDQAIALALFAGALRYMPQATEDQKAAYELFLKNRIDMYRGAGKSIAMARAHYNLGNFLRESNPRSALYHYRQASKNDPSYLKRHYYHTEIAGLHFEIGNFHAAARSYKLSLDLGRDNSVLPLYADSLMFAGLYSQSLKSFVEYMRIQHPRPAKWDLKAMALNAITKSLNISRQMRHPENAIKLADIRGKSDHKNLIERLHLALREDALCGLAWFNRGVHMAQIGEHQEAYYSFTICGLCQPGDVEAWANAFLLASSVHSLDLWFCQAIIESAYFHNGERFVQAVHDDMKKRGPEFPKDEVIKSLDSAVTILKDRIRRGDPRELRVIDAAGKVLATVDVESGRVNDRRPD